MLHILAIVLGYHPPDLPSNRPPAYRQSPRDAMLKEPDSADSSSGTEGEITPAVPQTHSSPEPFIFSTRFKFPPLVGPKLLHVL